METETKRVVEAKEEPSAVTQVLYALTRMREALVKGRRDGVTLEDVLDRLDAETGSRELRRRFERVIEHCDDAMAEMAAIESDLRLLHDAH